MSFLIGQGDALSYMLAYWQIGILASGGTLRAHLIATLRVATSMIHSSPFVIH